MTLPSQLENARAASLLLRAHRAGVNLFRVNHQLRYKASPPEALTAELRDEIAAQKQTILLILSPWDHAVCPAASPSQLPSSEELHLLVALYDPSWRNLGLEQPCLVCSKPTVWISPSGSANCTMCDPLLGVL